MHNSESRKAFWRSLLTETLPYEVPVIFSNDNLFASLVRGSSNAEVEKVLVKLRTGRNSFTRPYSYGIAKDERRVTSLAIIHPNHQMQIAEFYDAYSRSIIDYCNKSDVSLRRPIAEVPFFSSNYLSAENTHKNGIPHVEPEDGEIDVSYLPSYFTYGRFNLLGKFVESQEFRRLEKRFKLLRTLDISKCFFNIYTHSVTWAAKEKNFAKENSELYSFDGRFDRLMQRANFNETNGIVVGPEVSRIFAEIILQDVDRRVIAALGSMQHGRDYAIRRYVDDFYLFASSDTDLDQVQNAIQGELEFYKLFLNDHKTSTAQRPFVSNITLAKSELGGLISDMHAALDAVTSAESEDVLRRKVRELRRLVADMRLISKRYSVSFSALSGWLLTTLRTMLRRSVAAVKSCENENFMQSLTDIATALLEVICYIVAMDKRVRSTYSLCQSVAAIESLDTVSTQDARDKLNHVIGEELEELIKAPSLDVDGQIDNIEIQNLIIIGVRYLGSDFARRASVEKVLIEKTSSSKISYFWYITCKFCFLSDKGYFFKELDVLNRRVRAMLDKNINEVGIDAEKYMLACDYLSAPDVDKADKRTLLVSLVGGQPSNDTAEKVGLHVGFSDWSGVRIEHLLARKELRPLYAWA